MSSFADLFIKLYSGNYGNVNISLEDKEALNTLLTNFIHNTIGYHFDNKYDTSFLMFYFYSFYHHIKSPESFIDDVKNYIYGYYDTINTHPFVKLFIDVIKWIYCDSYNGKLGTKSYNPASNVVLDIYDNRMIIKNTNDNNLLPTIQINDIDGFEVILKEYISTIKNSDTLYNIFNKDGFTAYELTDKIKMLIEGTILNTSLHDLYNIESFFSKYTQFINDPILKSQLDLQFVGNDFNDELFFKVKKSDFEYETPYSLSYMLRNHRYEFPNVRVGIEQINGKSTANIITTQTSQLTGENTIISDLIKQKVPKTSKYRYYKPNHFMSLLMSFGLFNGMGINEISVQTFMPLRYYKTIRDKNMAQDEANDYLGRMIDKNKNTYYRLLHISQNLEMEESNNKMYFYNAPNHMINWQSDYLNDIYQMFYDHGARIRK